MRNKAANRSVETAIARLAARQHGVVSLSQLAAAGLHRSTVVRRTRKGLLYRIHRGVYAVGHTGLSNEGRWMAAVLACGEGAVLSHRSAGALWTIVPLPNVIEVTLPGTAGRPTRRDQGSPLAHPPTQPDHAASRHPGHEAPQNAPGPATRAPERPVRGRTAAD